MTSESIHAPMLNLKEMAASDAADVSIPKLASDSDQEGSGATGNAAQALQVGHHNHDGVCALS